MGPKIEFRERHPHHSRTWFTQQVRTQLKLEGRSDMTLAAFYEHYLACTAGFGKTYSDSFTDIFAIADMIHKLCKEDCIPSEWDGLELPSGRRVEPQLVRWSSSSSSSSSNYLLATCSRINNNAPISPPTSLPRDSCMRRT